MLVLTELIESGQVTPAVDRAFPLAEAAEALAYLCLLYTSDAADERSSVDLGGCRIIKKKTTSYIAAQRTLSTTCTNVELLHTT